MGLRDLSICALLSFGEIDERFGVAAEYEGDITYRLVREDGTNTFEPRAWMARKRVDDKDGPPLQPSAKGVFSLLKHNAQYRLDVMGRRKKIEKVEGGYVAKTITLTEDDASSMEEKATCSCKWGNPCLNEYVCKNWANRFQVAKENGWNGHGTG